jgi:hypothetical protein
MWNPFKKKESGWQVAIVYDHEVCNLEDYYGSTVKSSSELLHGKGVPVVWTHTLTFSYQWLSVGKGYKIDVERDDKNALTKYHWIKIN